MIAVLEQFTTIINEKNIKTNMEIVKSADCSEKKMLIYLSV